METTIDRVVQQLQALAEAPLAPGLYVVSTPIGNLCDITLRAIAVLARVDIILCEDTRHSGKLLRNFAINSKLRPYHDHNGERERPRILDELRCDKRIALISDAGTPLISDPGYKLVHEARSGGLNVFVVPGPSAVTAALSVAGLATDMFLFAGFLPSKRQARLARLKDLAQLDLTIILFETAKRLAVLLDDIAAIDGTRKIAIARELTKLHEEVLIGAAAELAERVGQSDLRGEIVVALAAPEHRGVSDEDIQRALDTALRSMSVRDAARHVADQLCVPRRQIYEEAVRLAANRRPRRIEE